MDEEALPTRRTVIATEPRAGSITSREVAKHPVWSRILDTYFETLKTTFREETEALANEESPSAEALEGVHQRSREAAVQKAFEGVDLREIERAWKEYTLSLKAPKR